MIPEIRPRQLPSTYFPIHCSLYPIIRRHTVHSLRCYQRHRVHYELNVTSSLHVRCAKQSGAVWLSLETCWQLGPSLLVAVKELVLLKQFCVSSLVIFIGCSYFLGEGLLWAVIQLGKKVIPEPEGSLPSLQQHTITVYPEPTGQFTFL
jgi:hypothetical protein